MNEYEVALRTIGLIALDNSHKIFVNRNNVKYRYSREYKLLYGLVEKETPRRVKTTTKEDYEETGYRYCCPVCGCMVGTLTEDYGLEISRYCCTCGQKLDWSDIDE